MYKLFSFAGVTLPEFIKEKNIGPAAVDGRILDSVGGAFDYYGTDASYARKQELGFVGQIVGEDDYLVDHSGNRIVDHSGNYIMAGTNVNRLRAQYEALAALVGLSGLLVRERHDDGVKQERRCALVSLVPEEIVLDRLAKVALTFQAAQPYWRSQSNTTGQVSFSTSAASFSVNNSGNAVVFDGVLTVTATSTITSIVITNAGTNAHLVWAGTLNSSESLVIDCAAETIEIDGADAYGQEFTLGAGHSAVRWCPLAQGVNTLAITANGTGTFAVAFREQWQ